MNNKVDEDTGQLDRREGISSKRMWMYVRFDYCRTASMCARAWGKIQLWLTKYLLWAVGRFDDARKLVLLRKRTLRQANIAYRSSCYNFFQILVGEQWACWNVNGMELIYAICISFSLFRRAYITQTHACARIREHINIFSVCECDRMRNASRMADEFWSGKVVQMLGIVV